MSEREQDGVLKGVDLDRPNPARIYDYLLGGHQNFAADRAAAEKLLEVLPSAAEGAAVNRAFLRRVIDVCTAAGVEQFLDIGSGLPTMGNVHELARATSPEARVVYVDIDPVVVAHSSRLLQDDPQATIIEADLRYPTSILNHAEVGELLDFRRPMALTMTAVLHFVTDDDLAYRATRTLVEALAPGSYVVISHTLVEERSRSMMKEAVEHYRTAGSSKVRRRDQIARFFEGLELLEPGLVRGPLWRPESADDLLLDRPETYSGLVGVGRKP